MTAEQSQPGNSVQTGAKITIALCFAVAVLEGFDIQAIGIAAPRLGPELGLEPAVLGKALAASNIGLVFGAAFGGWLADLWGRKPVLIGSVFLFGLFTLATMVAPNFPTLYAVRLAVGLGFGAALPNIMAMAAEVAPPGKRGSTATMMFCGMPAGGGTVALISALNPDQGWRVLFLIGGLLPLIIIPALILLLKETRGEKAAAETESPGARVVSKWWFWALMIPVFLILNLAAQRITSETGANASFLSVGEGGVGFSLPFANLLQIAAPWLALIGSVVVGYMIIHRRPLFGEGRAPASVLLWLNFLPTLLILYLILNWLPTLITGKGFPGVASWASVCFNYGSVAGALIFGLVVDRFGIKWSLTGAYAALIAALFGLAAVNSPALILLMSAAIGFTLMGANYSMYGVAASYYPTHMRGRGSGATVAWGRLGAVAAPLLGGYLLQGGSSANNVVLSMAPAAVVAGLAIVLLTVFAKPAAD
jgi:AAHS family 3-hydroxyphenylpropionic acid transporter